MNFSKRHFGSFVGGCIAPLLGALFAGRVAGVMHDGEIRNDVLMGLVIAPLCALIGIACVKAGSTVDALREHKKN